MIFVIFIYRTYCEFSHVPLQKYQCVCVCVCVCDYGVRPQTPLGMLCDILYYMSVFLNLCEIAAR